MTTEVEALIWQANVLSFYLGGGGIALSYFEQNTFFLTMEKVPKKNKKTFKL